MDLAHMDFTHHLAAVLTVLWLVYGIWLATWVIMQKREPAATMSCPRSARL